MLIDPSPARILPGKAGFGLLRRCAAAVLAFPASRAAPTRPNRPGRRIRFLWLRLDRPAFRSKPPDPDLTARKRRYRFGFTLLLKSPPGSEYSTRSPTLFKNIYAEALFLALSPLSFLEFEPAVQHLTFCELDPGVNVYSCFSPRFLQKTP